jgi:arylsulfatase A-like enzyme
VALQPIVFGTFLLALVTSATAVAAPPNFVVILADDLGYGEIGARHVGDVPTPNIDAIARAGVTITDGYATAPLCVPSRAGLLTGRYQQEFGIYGNP